MAINASSAPYLAEMIWSERTREWCVKAKRRDGAIEELWVSAPKRTGLRELAKILRQQYGSHLDGKRVDVFADDRHRGAFEYDLDGHAKLMRKGA